MLVMLPCYAVLSTLSILLRLYFAELHIRTDLEVLRLLLAVADQLLLPDLTDRLAGEISRGVAVRGVPACVSLACNTAGVSKVAWSSLWPGLRTEQLKNCTKLV